MREQKYRVWDKDKNKMHGLPFLSIGYYKLGRNEEEAVKLDFGDVSLGGGSLHDDYWIDDMKIFELMQYTGLKDCKGQEIFEGDIVRINHPQDLTGDFTNAIGEVFWWEEEGGWYHGNNNGRPPKRMWKHVEVIGNIYEHGYLLE